MSDNPYAEYIERFLRDGSWTIYTTVQEYLPTLLPVVQKIYYSGSIITSQLLSILYPLFAKLYATHPDIASIGLLIAVLYVTLRTFQIATRWMYGLAMGMVKIVIVLAIGMVVSRISQRGVEQTVDDLKGVWGVLESVGGVGMQLLEAAMNTAEEGKRTKGKSAGPGSAYGKGKTRGGSKGFW